MSTIQFSQKTTRMYYDTSRKIVKTCTINCVIGGIFFYLNLWSTLPKLLKLTHKHAHTRDVHKTILRWYSNFQKWIHYYEKMLEKLIIWLKRTKKRKYQLTSQKTVY